MNLILPNALLNLIMLGVNMIILCQKLYLKFAKRMELPITVWLQWTFKGKDQHDRERATSKSLISSYIDAGSDIFIAEDAFIALHYGNVLKHSKCA